MLHSYMFKEALTNSSNWSTNIDQGHTLGPTWHIHKNTTAQADVGTRLVCTTSNL